MEPILVIYTTSIEDRVPEGRGGVSGSDCDTFDSTASSSGVMQPSCLARMTKFQSGSNFFQPEA